MLFIFFDRFLFYLLIKLEVQYDSILVIGKVAVAVGYSVKNSYKQGVIDIPFTKMLDLLERLGITIDEFLYIHREYKKIPGKQLIRLNQLKPGNTAKIRENIHELKAISHPTKHEIEGSVAKF